MKEKLLMYLSIAIAVMGVVHIVATFTPLIGESLETLPLAKQNAMIYMSVMCGILLIVCGLLAAMLYGKVNVYSFLRLPYTVIIMALVADGVSAVAYMPHNPFAWLVFVLIVCLVIISFVKKKE